jgi:hypothetical protein
MRARALLPGVRRGRAGGDRAARGAAAAAALGARRANARPSTDAPFAPTRSRARQVLEGASSRSKAAMRAGREPECLLDFWAQQVNADCDVSHRIYTRA